MKIEFKTIPVLMAALILAACSFPGDVKNISDSDNGETLWHQGNKFWEKRQQTKQARTAQMFYRRAAELLPDNGELQVQLSRASYFVGHYCETDPARQDSLFAIGAAAGKRALLLSDVYCAAYENAEGDSVTREIAAVSAAPPELVPALYWWAANVGRLMAYKPVLKRLEYQEVIETALHRVLALDPDYYYGAAYRFFGALYARIPGIELSRAKDYFDLAVSKHPDYLGTYTLRAEFYHTKAGNRELFHQDLQHVLDADPTVLPDVMPENLLEQDYARRLLDREHLLFE